MFKSEDKQKHVSRKKIKFLNDIFLVRITNT